MKEQLKGGLETVIAAVIIIGLVVALIIGTVIPMSSEGDALISATTDTLVDHQETIKPQI